MTFEVRLVAVPEDFDEQVAHAELNTIAKWDDHTLESLKTFKERGGKLGAVWSKIVEDLQQ